MIRIHSFSRILAFPFLIVAGVILYFLFFEDRESWYPYLIPIAMILAAIYAFHPKIDFWWHKKQAPVAPPKLKKLVTHASPYFRELDEDMKQRFLDRLGIFMYHKAYYIMRKEKEAMPEDIKALIAICAISLGLHDEDYFFDKYDYFIAYQHPFPTPVKQYLHSVELNHEDGVMLFNAEQLFQSMLVGKGSFNIAMYAFAEAYLILHPLSDLAQADEPDPSKLPEKGEYSFESIILQIGYKEVYFKAVLIALYFQAAELLKKNYPDFYILCEEHFSNRGK